MAMPTTGRGDRRLRGQGGGRQALLAALVLLATAVLVAPLQPGARSSPLTRVVGSGSASRAAVTDHRGTSGPGAVTLAGAGPAASAAAASAAGPATSGQASSASVLPPIFKPKPTPTPTPPPNNPPPNPNLPSYLAQLNMVSYFPGATSGTPWDAQPMDTGQLTADLARIASLHANAVRVGVGATTPPADEAQNLDTLLTIAHGQGLRVELELFQGYAGYNVPASEWYANTLLSPFAGDPRIAALEVQNEIVPSNPAAMAWARSMIPYLRSIDAGIPVTISEGGWCDSLAQIRDLRYNLQGVLPDFWDVHFYCSPASAFATFSDAVSMAAPVPVLIGEAGYSTSTGDPSNPGYQYGTAWEELEQAAFFAAVDEAARGAGLGAVAPWVDSDITASCGCTLKERYFGLFRSDGSAKPAASVVSSAFQAARPLPDFNLGFEEDAGGFPADWSIQVPNHGTFAHDSSVAHSGAWSVRISSATRDRSGAAPAWALDVAQPIAAGQTYTVTSWAKGSGVDGNVCVSIVWNDTTGRGLGYAISDALPYGDTNWTPLTVSSQAPSGAAYMEIVLSSVAQNGVAWFDDVSLH